MSKGHRYPLPLGRKSTPMLGRGGQHYKQRQTVLSLATGLLDLAAAVGVQNWQVPNQAPYWSTNLLLARTLCFTCKDDLVQSCGQNWRGGTRQHKPRPREMWKAARFSLLLAHRWVMAGCCPQAGKAACCSSLVWGQSITLREMTTDIFSIFVSS